VSGYEWYHVLDDFLQRKTAMAIEQQQLRYRHLQSGKKPRCRAGRVLPPFRMSPVARPWPFMSHWQACINSRSRNKRAAFLFLLWGDKQADLAADRRSGAGDDTRIGLVEPGLQEGVRRTSRGGRADQLAEMPMSTAPRRSFSIRTQDRSSTPFMIGVNEVVSGANPAKIAMTNAAEKANAAIRG